MVVHWVNLERVQLTIKTKRLQQRPVHYYNDWGGGGAMQMVSESRCKDGVVRHGRNMILILPVAAGRSRCS